MALPSKHTIANAIAFLGIVDHTRGLHARTTVWLHDLYDFTVDSRPLHRLNETGLQIARTSRLWKAHQHLLSLGFKVDAQRARSCTCKFIPYVHKDCADRTAFTGAHGRAYVQPPREADVHARKFVPCELDATFKNGAE